MKSLNDFSTIDRAGNLHKFPKADMQNPKLHRETIYNSVSDINSGIRNLGDRVNEKRADMRSDVLQSYNEKITAFKKDTRVMDRRYHANLDLTEVNDSINHHKQRRTLEQNRTNSFNVKIHDTYDRTVRLKLDEENARKEGHFIDQKVD